MSISKKGIVNIPHIVLSQLKSWNEQVEQTEMIWMNKSCHPLRKAKERYWMMELGIMDPHCLNDRYAGFDRYGLYKGFCKLNFHHKNLTLIRLSFLRVFFSGSGDQIVPTYFIFQRELL